MGDRYILMALTDDGPSRIQGKAWHASECDAVQAAERLLREGGHGSRITVFRELGTYWLDPEPRVLNNLPNNVPDKA